MPQTQATKAPIGVFGILKESARLYKSYWRAFTKPLIAPVARMILGAYGCLALGMLFVNTMTTTYQAFAEQNIALILLALGVICIVTIRWFGLGAWEYLVYMASLSVNAREVMQGRAPDFKNAYQTITGKKGKAYKMLLLAYCALPLLAGLPLIGLSLLSGFARAPINLVLFGAGLLLSGLAFAALLVYLFFLTYIFQLTAFEETRLNPLPTFMRSTRLTWRAPVRTVALQLVLLLATGYLLPLPAVLLCRLTQLAMPVDSFHLWLTGLTLAGAEPEASGWAEVPYYSWAYDLILGSAAEIARALTDSLLMVVITTLLLPLGTFAFTRLYLEISERDTATPENPTLPLPEASPGAEAS